MQNPEELPLEDFLRWLCAKRRTEENGKIKEKSYRFGNSVWVIGRQADMAKVAMTSKAVINNRMQKLEKEGYLHYTGLWTYELTEKGLKAIGSKLPDAEMPGDYEDYKVKK